MSLVHVAQGRYKQLSNKEPPVNFESFLEQTWNRHSTDPTAVAVELEGAIPLITQGEHIAPLAQLIAHVCGEHLGRWDQGLALLNQLQQLPVSAEDRESQKTLLRLEASLRVAKEESRHFLDKFSSSDQIRILTTAASALSEQRASLRAMELFHQALALAETAKLAKDDPAIRALAVTGNNIACALEEKESLGAEEAELMILAALSARKFWELAGTWLEVERAEYRLSRSHLKAGDASRALKHAQGGLEIARSNKAPALELFFSYEAIALAEKASGNVAGFRNSVEQAEIHFEQLSDSDKPWCKSTLDGLT